MNFDRSESATVRLIVGLTYEMRPWQWYKQAVVLLGIIFSRNIDSIAAWQNVGAAVIAFSAVAGATYIVNDINDVEADRRHQTKQNRPIASGMISIKAATGFAALLLLAGLFVASAVNTLLLITVIGYFLQNLLYSFLLKEIVIVDVITVAVGFVLRAIAGVVAIEVFLSPWLVTCTFLTALLLAFGKRRHELIATDHPEETRSTLETYSKTTLDHFLIVTLATLLVAYSLYTFFRTSNTMMVTLPFAFYGAFRYYLLTQTTDIGETPSRLLLDRPFIINIIIWGAVAIAILYQVPEPFFELLDAI